MFNFIAMNRKGDPCLVCGTTQRTSYHFGTTSCMACASFFRRTVSFGIRFLCKEGNRCPISQEIRFFCRSCRYDKCISAGMNRGQVQQKRDDNNVPKYVLDSRKLGVQEIVRGYTTSRTVPTEPAEPITHGFTGSTGSTRSTSPETSPAEPSKKSQFSIILNTYPDDLLQYYVKQVEMSMIHKQLGLLKNTLLVKSVEELVDISETLNDLSMEACLNCPGVDILRQRDVEVILKSFHFANVWMDSIWAYSRHSESIVNKFFENNGPLSMFINQIKSTLGSSLSQIKLNIYEFAALKAFCVWKLSYHDSTISINIMSEEQYIGICSALRKHYEATTNMTDVDIAMRIAEITLQIVPATTIYQDTIRFYQQHGLIDKL